MYVFLKHRVLFERTRTRVKTGKIPKPKRKFVYRRLWHAISVPPAGNVNRLLPDPPPRFLANSSLPLTCSANILFGQFGLHVLAVLAVYEAYGFPQRAAGTGNRGRLRVAGSRPELPLRGM